MTKAHEVHKECCRIQDRIIQQYNGGDEKAVALVNAIKMYEALQDPGACAMLECAFEDWKKKEDGDE